MVQTELAGVQTKQDMERQSEHQAVLDSSAGRMGGLSPQPRAPPASRPRGSPPSAPAPSPHPAPRPPSPAAKQPTTINTQASSCGLSHPQPTSQTTGVLIVYSMLGPEGRWRRAERASPAVPGSDGSRAGSLRRRCAPCQAARSAPRPVLSAAIALPPAGIDALAVSTLESQV